MAFQDELEIVSQTFASMANAVIASFFLPPQSSLNAMQEATLNVVGPLLTSANALVDVVNNTLHTHESHLGVIDDSVANILIALEDINTSIAVLSARLDAVDSTLTDHENRITALEGGA